MFADTIFRAEQQHLLRLLLWSGLSILAGTAVLVLLTVRRLDSALLRQFAVQMTVWGALLGAITAVRWQGLHMRDLSHAARFERWVWLNVGLDAGVVGIGATLVICAWLLARRAGPLGAGIGIVVQGLALLVIDLQLAAVVSR